MAGQNETLAPWPSDPSRAGTQAEARLTYAQERSSLINTHHQRADRALNKMRDLETDVAGTQARKIKQTGEELATQGSVLTRLFLQAWALKVTGMGIVTLAGLLWGAFRIALGFGTVYLGIVYGIPLAFELLGSVLSAILGL